MDWKQVLADFKRDGALRDIYVQGTSLDDWQAVIDLLRPRVPPGAFTIDGDPAELPVDVSVLFSGQPDAPAYCLGVPMGEATLNCHFFCVEEIEFDLDPGEMAAEQLDPLIAFLRLLGTTCGKAVILSMENMPEATILRFDPELDEVFWSGSVQG